MPVRLLMPDEGHTLASMMRATLHCSGDTSIASCIVNDDTVDTPGVFVRAECAEDIVNAIDANLAWLQRVRDQLGVPTSAPARPAP